MKILHLFFAAILIISVSTISLAGNLQPTSPPGSTMKTLDEVEPRIPIGIDTTPGDANSSYKITSPGSYYLTGNVTSNFKHAILIDSDDVTVDLMGYRLWSSYSKPMGSLDFDGIHLVAERQNIEIRNGSIASDNRSILILTFRGFRNGIYAEDDTDVIRVKDVRDSDARNDGISVKGTGHMVQRCTCMRNEGFGIYLYNNAAVFNNTCCSNGVHGICIRDNGTAADNTCNDNASFGILAWSGWSIHAV